MHAIFVTGTDTGVGKTHVGVGLIHAWRRAGRQVGVCKPAESGCENGAPPDATALLAAAQSGQTLDEVCPYRLRAALTPAEAARLEGVRVDFAGLVGQVRAMARRFDVLLVEGAGGLLAPLADDLTYLDFVLATELPVLVVAANRLGCLNHTLLTDRVLQEAGAATLGIVLNDIAAERTPDMASNAAILERMAIAPLLGRWPQGGGEDQAAARVLAALEAHAR
jgi:dethiobiotin synthetase